MPPVAGYTAWYQADQITGISDNTGLPSWADSSGNGHNLTASPTKPTYYSTTVAKILNGLPTVWFVAASSTYEYNSVATALAQPLDVFVVSRHDVTTGSNESTVGIIGTQIGYQNANTILSGGGTALTATSDTNWHVVTYRLNGSGTSSIRIDGTQVASNTTAGTNSPGTNQYYIGSGSGGSIFFDGGIAEVIIYSASTLASADVTTTENYLIGKWLTSYQTGTVSILLGPISLSAIGTVIPNVTGTASVPLGPVSLTSTSAIIPTGYVALPLGPLTITTRWTAATLLPLGPLALTSTSINIAVATLTLGPLTLTASTSPHGGGGSLTRIRSSPRTPTTIRTIV